MMKIWLKFKLPLTLCILLLGVFLCGDMIPEQVKGFFYATSLSLKEILFVLLPFIIFSFLFSSILTLQRGAIAFVGLLFVMVYCSNFMAIVTAEAVGHLALSWLHIPTDYQSDGLFALTPLWDLKLPKLIPNEVALISGLGFGLLASFYPNQVVTQLASRLNRLANHFLRHYFVPLLPLFILGFIFKIHHDGMLERVVTVYGSVLCVVVSLQVSYISLLYMIAARFSISQFVEYLRNVMPAAITGFTAMSSAAALPLSIVAAEQNTKDPEIARAVAPASVNIHTLGSAIGMTTLAFATLLTFGHSLPSFSVAIIFAFYYAVAKFAVAGVPGGGDFRGDSTARIAIWVYA